MTLMSLGGFALTSDHTHLVYQRDTLKAATDAASLAAIPPLAAGSWSFDRPTLK